MSLTHRGVRQLQKHLLAVLVMIAQSSLAAGDAGQQGRAKTSADDYRNPILFADYSDPDVIRDGDTFYLVASSFHFVPGIPILQSHNLAHWILVGHAVPRLSMSPKYDMTGGMAYGRGIWAPAVRFHAGLFYIYFPTPDEGIFVVTAPRMTGPWSAPEVVLSGPGLEDPCPFWDDDGQAYLVHSKLGAGPLILHRMSTDGKHLLDAGKVIVEDHVHLPVLEGPKFYKRDGWYYIFAPVGGVEKGTQAVLRSRSIDGPYDYRIVLAQGTTSVNGPHQGAYIETPDGRGWFLHFQQRGAHGRMDWLEPVQWKDDWPLIGNVPRGATTGQPVMSYALPVVSSHSSAARPQTSDNFDGPQLAPMWEWNHNPENSRWSLTERRGFLRLHPMQAADLLHARNTLTETMQDESLEVTIRLDVSHMTSDDAAGLSVLERGASSIGVVQTGLERRIVLTSNGANVFGPTLKAAKHVVVVLRARVTKDIAQYGYSTDGGRTFTTIGNPVELSMSWWKGARPALFAYNTQHASVGWVDFDWLHYSRLR